MNIAKQFCLAALVGVMVLGLKGEEKMPRGQRRATTNAALAVQQLDGTGNLSKKRREELIGKIGEIRSFLEKSGDTNATRLISFAAELEKEVRQKKYGLVFEEHKERVDIDLEKKLPVLTENKKRFIDKGGELNFLIEGDNLAALKLLEKTHKGKIDLIYIDPPYNTGNKDFVYNDSYVEKEDLFRHSKWLSFMKKRLKIAQRLLADKGVIFVSIDDHEYANLKVICDEIFDESNVETMVWHKVDNDSGKLKVTHRFRIEHEYILVLYNNKDQNRFHKYLQKRNYKNKYTNPDNDPRGEYKQGIISDTEEKSSPNSANYYSVTTPSGKVFTRRWRVPKTEFDALRLDNRIYFGKKGDAVPSLKVFVNEEGLTTPVSILECLGTAKSAGQELIELFDGEKKFSYPKPVPLVRHLVNIASDEKACVVDFFAGSGTTGHAVMKLNANEATSMRKFILVTNNENGICENVTYERLRLAIDKEGYKARLKYFKVDYVPIERQVYFEYADELLKHIRELVELENAIDFNTDETIAITLTDAEFEKFVANEKKMAGKKAVYVGHDVLIGSKARKLLQGKGIEIRIIPEYYYAEQEG